MIYLLVFVASLAGYAIGYVIARKRMTKLFVEIAKDPQVLEFFLKLAKKETTSPKDVQHHFDELFKKGKL